jgi:hypothetical protein
MKAQFGTIPTTITSGKVGNYMKATGTMRTTTTMAMTTDMSTTITREFGCAVIA